MAPRVTVYIPCYNYGRYLEGCVASVLSQDGVDVDVMIVDDASPDGSGDVAAAIAAKDARVQVIRHERNQGHIATYNDGLAAARGDYVVLLSADDLLAPGSLARATEVMEADPRVGLVYGNPVVFEDGQPLPRPRTRARSVSRWSGRDWISAQCRRGLSIIYCPEAVVRTSVHRRVGGYSSALPHTADLELWLRIAAVSDVARVNGADQAYRRDHAASMMHTDFAGALTDLRERRHTYASFFAGCGAALPAAVRDAATIRRTLSKEALGLACQMAARGEAEAAEYAAFAHDTLGEETVTRMREWREYEARRSGRTRGPAALAVAYRRAARELDGRLGWYRWRWSGV